MMKKVYGNTFPIKDKIRERGGKWNAQEKSWYVPDDRLEEIRALMSVNEKASPAKLTKTLELNGQLWEECPHCGEEPVYMSLGCICEDCARKGRRCHEQGWL